VSVDRGDAGLTEDEGHARIVPTSTPRWLRQSLNSCALGVSSIAVMPTISGPCAFDQPCCLVLETVNWRAAGYEGARHDLPSLHHCGDCFGDCTPRHSTSE
jgi:hypothetical protein